MAHYRDFNSVTSQAEKWGGKPFACSSNSGLRHFIILIGLVDLGFNDNPFSWNNCRKGQENIRERPDRGIANHKWRLLHPNASILHALAIVSDHLPVILNTDGHGILALSNLRQCGSETWVVF